MQKIHFLLAAFLLMAINANGQNNQTDQFQFKSKSISLGISNINLPITFSQMLSDRVLVGITPGLAGFGLEASYYITNPQSHSLSLYTSLAGGISYMDGNRTAYWPVGVSYLSKNNFQIKIEGGAMFGDAFELDPTNQTVGYTTTAFLPYLGLNIGYRFGKDIQQIKDSKREEKVASFHVLDSIQKVTSNNKNIIFGTIASNYGITYEASINFEHKLKEKDGNKTTYIGAGIGAYVGPWIYGQYYSTYYGMLKGAKASRMETNFGLTVVHSPDHNRDWLLLPLASIGLRRQKADQHFIFRTGIAFPEGIYLGLGYSL